MITNPLSLPAQLPGKAHDQSPAANRNPRVGLGGVSPHEMQGLPSIEGRHGLLTSNKFGNRRGVPNGSGGLSDESERSQGLS